MLFIILVHFPIVQIQKNFLFKIHSARHWEALVSSNGNVLHKTASWEAIIFLVKQNDECVVVLLVYRYRLTSRRWQVGSTEAALKLSLDG